MHFSAYHECGAQHRYNCKINELVKLCATTSVRTHLPKKKTKSKATIVLSSVNGIDWIFLCAHFAVLGNVNTHNKNYNRITHTHFIAPYGICAIVGFVVCCFLFVICLSTRWVNRIIKFSNCEWTKKKTTIAIRLLILYLSISCAMCVQPFLKNTYMSHMQKKCTQHCTNA